MLKGARLGDSLVDVQLDDGRISDILPAGVAEAWGDTIELDGRWLLPGLWDHHVHLSQVALTMRRVDLATATSAADAARLMGDALAVAPPEGELPLVGAAFRDGLWPDTPTAALLDAAVGSTPTVLVSGDLHTTWLDTAALAKYGFAGHATGVLVEDDAFAVTAELQNVPENTIDAWLQDAATHAATRGVVGVVELEMADNISQWRRRCASGFSGLRIQAGIYSPYLDAAVAAGHRTGDPLDDTGLLTVGPFKILTDGSLNTRTAYCVDPYPGTTERGMLTVTTDELLPLLRTALGGGIVPAVHAIGDEAVRLALDAFELAGNGELMPHGTRMEHAQLVRDRDFARFAALGVAASVQPEHAMDDRDIAEHYWAGRTGRSFALRSLLDAGAELLLGSDAPVAPLDPWVTLNAAVTRSRDGREPWHPEQAISVGEGLAASTQTVIDVGQPADLIAVDRDPHDPGNLVGMPVALTLLAGRATHSTL
ncbi:MAG TPA: amidohydrolase family protein [Terrimesophilobacter sp.]|nr:amidohydrolase family protein [Terrimesophilobacter sp.]